MGRAATHTALIAYILPEDEDERPRSSPGVLDGLTGPMGSKIQFIPVLVALLIRIFSQCL